jgi:hypothetical protein
MVAVKANSLESARVLLNAPMLPRPFRAENIKNEVSGFCALDQWK